MQLNVRFTATRNGREAAIRTGHSEIAAPVETLQQPEVEMTPQAAVERRYEERWVQRGAEEGMTLEELIRWRRQEERMIHGEDPNSEEDDAPSEDEVPADERDVPPEREAPPERSDPPERADPPQRGDPFDNMSEEERAAWRRAERPVLRHRIRLRRRCT